MNNTILFVAAASLSIVLSACSSKSDADMSKNIAPSSIGTDQVKDSINPISTEENGKFSDLFARYQNLILALSSDNDKEAATAAEEILDAISRINSDSFKAEDRVTYKDIASNIEENAQHIVDNVGNIKHQREHLVILSEDLYDIAKLFGVNKPIYKVVCATAGKDSGSYWLSNSKEIKNPYYGGKDSCGEIQEELK